MTITKETTKKIRKWLASNGFKVGCRLGKEFYYEPEENYIAVASNYDDSFDTDFMACLRKQGMTSNFDVITLSILHELGHKETEKYFTSNEWEDDSVVKSVLPYTTKSQKRLNFEYWATPTEFSANNWLIMYCKCFPQKVEELENIVSELYWK